MKNRWLITAILAIAICFSLIPTPAHAAALIKTGTCGDQGDNLTWTLDDTGLLTISGTGGMAPYDEGNARWFPYWEQITAVVIEEGVTDISDQAFESCANITAVTIPQTVTKIGDKAFNGCSSLESIFIPDSVTVMGLGTFQGCSSLTEVTLSNTLTNIREFCFNGCSSLVSVWIPGSVSNIGECAFADCSNLLSVTIPKEMYRIGLQAFHNCKRLWHVFYTGTEEDWAKIKIMADQNELHWAGRHYTCNGTETVDPATKTCSICIERCEHNWNTGTVTKQPTRDEEGVLTYTCIDCNSTKNEPIEKLADSPADGENPTEPSTTEPVEQTCGNTVPGTIPWWWLVVVGGICIVSNVVFVIIILKKKK